MRNYILSIALFALTVISLSSCLGDGDTIVYNDDAAITSFSLGTLNAYYHTTAKDGSDSIYKRTINCSSYVMSIDQERGLIWNNDSLPTHVDLSAVICTVNAKNGGTIAIKSLTSDSLSAYKSSDSIDFRNPREFQVYNVLSTGLRKYTVTINAHKEEADSCVWTKVTTGNTQVAALSDMKALNLGENIYLFGTQNGAGKVYMSAIGDGANWTELATNPALTVEACKNVVLKNDKFYTLFDGKLCSSADAANWQLVSENALNSIVAASASRIYATDAEGKLLSSSDNGINWEAEALDADASFFPTEGISYACHTLRTDATAEKIVLIGNRSVENYPNDKYSMVWTKVEETKDGSRNHAWNLVEADPLDKYNAPRAENWQIVNYDGINIKGICGKGIGASTEVALSKVYNSGDDGITWINDSVMGKPAELSSQATSFTMTADKANSLWIICGGTGDVWKVRINRLVWKKADAWIKE